MSRIIAMVCIDKNHCYDLKWRMIIMSTIIAIFIFVYIDKNHCHDLKWGVIIMPRIIAMILTEELKLLLGFKLALKLV